MYSRRDGWHDHLADEFNKEAEEWRRKKGIPEPKPPSKAEQMKKLEEVLNKIKEDFNHGRKNKRH